MRFHRNRQRPGLESCRRQRDPPRPTAVEARCHRPAAVAGDAIFSEKHLCLQYAVVLSTTTTGIRQRYRIKKATTAYPTYTRAGGYVEAEPIAGLTSRSTSDRAALLGWRGALLALVEDGPALLVCPASPPAQGSPALGAST